MPSHPQRLALTATTLCLLTACTPTTPPPTPSPAPSYRCTPETGGDEHDCTQAQHDDMLAKDKLYTQAEAVYRKFFAEEVRILRAGGATAATPVLKETTTGAFLADTLDYYRSLKHDKATLVGGDVLLTALSRAPGLSKGGSVVAMRACVDASSARIKINGKDYEPGRKGAELLYFGRFDGALKIQGADGKESDSCE